MSVDGDRWSLWSVVVFVSRSREEGLRIDDLVTNIK